MEAHSYIVVWVPFTKLFGVFFLQFDEEAFTLRSREQHLIHCDDLEGDPANFDENSKEFGVNYRSQLLELRYFDICGGGLVADVMHDLLEGTLQYKTKLTLKHVISQHYVTYKTFANLLEGLELGYMEMDNKPTVIPARVINSDDKHLGQKKYTIVTVNTCEPHHIQMYVHNDVVCHFQLLRCGF